MVVEKNYWETSLLKGDKMIRVSFYIPNIIMNGEITPYVGQHPKSDDWLDLWSDENGILEGDVVYVNGRYEVVREKNGVLYAGDFPVSEGAEPTGINVYIQMALMRYNPSWVN